MKAETAIYFIGIDPGKYTGFAVWVPAAGEFDYLETLTFWEALGQIEEDYEPNKVIVVLEDPAQNKPTFFHKATGQRQREKISQDVGANKREAQLLAEGLERMGYRVKRVQPKTSKLSGEEFKALTGYEKRTNPHVRDAGMLVYGLKKVMM